MQIIILNGLRYVAMPDPPHWILHPLDIRVGDAILSRDEFNTLTLACGQKLTPPALRWGSEAINHIYQMRFVHGYDGANIYAGTLQNSSDKPILHISAQ